MSTSSSPEETATPRRDQLRRGVATVLLMGMVVLAFTRPDVSPAVLGVISGCGLALFGIDVPWSRIPWELLLRRGDSK